MTVDDHSRRGTVSLLRRVIVGVIIVSFSIAAIGGIAVLVGGIMDQTAGRVLATTAIVGAFSLAVLCCVTLAGRRLQAFGLVGAGVSVLTAGLIVYVVWAEEAWMLPDAVWELMWTGVALTAGFALASLLLLLADRRQAAVRIGLGITLGLFAVVLVMVLYLIWASESVDGDVFPRVLGIAAILAALGAIVVPVISLFLRGRSGSGALSAASVARLTSEAERRGLTPDALVDDLLSEAHTARPEPAGGERP